jgi:hypothetical protein
MTPYHKFQKPIPLAEGGYISTVDQALDLYFSLPMQVRIEGRWTEAAKLLVSTFDDNGEEFLERAERQFRFALERGVTIIEPASPPNACEPIVSEGRPEDAQDSSRMTFSPVLPTFERH